MKFLAEIVQFFLLLRSILVYHSLIFSVATQKGFSSVHTVPSQSHGTLLFFSVPISLIHAQNLI